MPFYIRNLSICRFWYPWRYWNKPQWLLREDCILHLVIVSLPHWNVHSLKVGLVHCICCGILSTQNMPGTWWVLNIVDCTLTYSRAHFQTSHEKGSVGLSSIQCICWVRCQANLPPYPLGSSYVKCSSLVSPASSGQVLWSVVRSCGLLLQLSLSSHLNGLVSPKGLHFNSWFRRRILSDSHAVEQLLPKGLEE